IYPPVPLTLHRGLTSSGATAPLGFYISFRCTNKTVEEDIFVRKTYVELQGQVPVLPNSSRLTDRGERLLPNTSSLSKREQQSQRDEI
ncbi:MAG: hypothetical protein K940chlam7_00727, partial [Chlamydiae bacterium]|nr:hypothetical protein [Chlamydiota bacterium]